MTQKEAIEKASELLAEAIQLIVNSTAVTVAATVAGRKPSSPAKEEEEDPSVEEERKPRRGKKVETEEEEEDEKPKGKKGKPAVEEDDDDDEDDDDEKGNDDGPDEDTLTELAGIDLESASRGEMKTLAVKLGFNAEGKRADQLREYLKGEQKKHAKGAKAAKPETGKKGKAAKEEESDDDLPSIKQMKKDFNIYAEYYRDQLEPKGFFGGKVKKGHEALEHTLEEILDDDDLIAEAWKDNVKPLVDDDSWDDIVKEVAEKD